MKIFEIKGILKFIGCISLIVFITTSCTTPPPKSELQNLDLLRGDLILCNGKKFGDVDFSLSCKVSVRETFDLALSLLHSFQYEEAEKAFVKIIDVDSECAMAYWGVAMSIYHAAWFPPSPAEMEKAVKVLSIAGSLYKTPKEKLYFDAIGSFYADWNNIAHATRAKTYEGLMEELHNQYPKDTEAAVLYALALYSTRDRAGMEYKNERKAGTMLEALMEEQPNHPGIAHYIIHNYDNPVLAHKALDVSRRYADIAPGSSHAQHMPSHIFTRLGLWDESIASNIKSVTASQCYVQEAGIEGRYFEELHAMDYMVYAYLQQGNNKKATELYQDLQRSDDFYPMNLSAAAYAMAAIPARLALENKDWVAAAKMEVNEKSINWSAYPWHKAIVHFTRALGAAHTNDGDKAKSEILTLRHLKDQLVSKNDPQNTNQINQIEAQIRSSQAWLTFYQGDTEEGLRLMKEAVDIENKTSKHPVTPGDVLPADEMLGDMLLMMNMPAEALAAFEQDLLQRPNRFNGIYGAAVAASQSGDISKAKNYYMNLMAMAKTGNSDRRELAEAINYLQVPTL